MPRKKLPIEEKRLRKKLAERRRMAKIKNDPELYAQWLVKSRANYQKKKAQGTVVPMSDLPPSQQKIRRKKSSQSSQRYYLKKKMDKLPATDELPIQEEPIYISENRDPLTNNGLVTVDAYVGTAAVDMPWTSSQSAIPALVDGEAVPGTFTEVKSPPQDDSEPDAEDMPGTFSENTSLAPVDSENDANNMPGLFSGITSQDSTSGNEIKIFCPKCNTEVSHTAEGIQEDKTKILIAKVYHYFEQEYEELKKMYGALDLTPLSKFRQRTALATGVSETTLQQILQEEEERNADKRREPPQKRRAARKRRRQTDSSSEEGSSDDNDEDIEQPSCADELETLVVKMEPPEYNNDEPEIFLPTEVKLEPSEGDISKAQLPMDPISVDVKTEPRDNEANAPNETLALEPAATKRRGRKISRKNDDTSTRQHTPGESSAPAASRSVPLSETFHETFLSGAREIKIEEVDIQEEGFS